MEILYFHGPTPQPIFQEFADRVRFIKGADSELLTKDALSQMHRKLIILDDCYSEVSYLFIFVFVYEIHVYDLIMDVFSCVKGGKKG